MERGRDGRRGGDLSERQEGPLIRVHCRTCLREERWRGDEREVVSEGGRRKPAVHPELAAWETLSAWLRGESGPVVAHCPCGQPLMADGEHDPIPWTIPLPDGAIEVRPGMDASAADARIRAAYRQRIDVPQTLFEGSLMTLMGLPILLWGGLLFLVFWILYNVLLGGADMGV